MQLRVTKSYRITKYSDCVNCLTVEILLHKLHKSIAPNFSSIVASPTVGHHHDLWSSNLRVLSLKTHNSKLEEVAVCSAFLGVRSYEAQGYCRTAERNME